MEKPIVFKNRDGKQLIGILHLPKGSKKFPLVVICHGLGSTKTQRRFVRLARALEKNGVVSFRFDFEGCGDSEGNFQALTVKGQIADLGLAMNWVLKQKWVDKNRIAFVGHSLGTLIVALYAAQSKFSAKSVPRSREFLLRGLVFWAPAFDQKGLFPVWQTPKDLKKWKKQGYLIRKDDKMGINYLKENQDKDYSPLLAKIKAPILIIHGQKDDVVPVKFSKKLAKEYQNIKLVIYSGADHKFEDYYIQQKLIRETTKWLKKHLKV